MGVVVQLMKNQSMHSEDTQDYKYTRLITRQEAVQVCGRPLFNYITKLKNPDRHDVLVTIYKYFSPL